jgi:Domain of Unknown Function (DUF748)
MNMSREHPSRLAAYIGLSLGATVLVVVGLWFVFGGAILNSYGKKKIEGAFAQMFPGSLMRIGKLDYSVSANRLVGESVTLTATNTTLQAARITLTGVRWVRLLWGAAAPADLLANASVDVTNLVLEFPEAHYGIRCARLRASVPASELIADWTELRTLVGDEEFFAEHDYRKARFHVVVPECRVLGLAFGELLRGKSYRARSVQFFRPSFDALVNCDKPVKQSPERPLMVQEALAAIREPVQVDNLSITNGHATYCERVLAGADPGVLTFGAVSMSVDGIANRGEAPAAILLRAQAEFMGSGALTVLMSLPITPSGFSLHYSGSLSAMDLTRLDAFLAITQHARIKSGNSKEAAFEIDVAAGRAQGRVQAVYENLEIAVLDRQTGSEKGLDNRVASFLANALVFRHSNAPDASGVIKEGKVNFTRGPEHTFLQFVWFALRSGVLDVISN